MSGALTTPQRAVLVAASLAVGLAFLDETAVVTALRAIQADLGLSSLALQWVMGAYLLALASLMAAAGRIADVHGRRRTFLVGAGIFALGSTICALAPTAGVLIAARGLQGVGAALLVPLGYANATLVVPEERRGWALGIISTGATVLLAAGPVLGGVLTQLFGWRSVFAVNLLPILVVGVVAVRWMPESHVERREAVDVAGLVLLVCGLAAMTTALLQVQSSGAVVTVATALVAAIALAGFVVVERRSASPLVDLSLLRIPAVAGSLTALLAFQFAILGLTVYLTLYLQHVLGFAPAVAGALCLPAVALAPFLAGRVGRATDRRGTRGLTVGGPGAGFGSGAGDRAAVSGTHRPAAARSAAGCSGWLDRSRRSREPPVRSARSRRVSWPGGRAGNAVPTGRRGPRGRRAGGRRHRPPSTAPARRAAAYGGRQLRPG